MGVWLRKSSHRFHGFAQMAWLRLFSHGIHGIHRSFVALIRPRNSQNSQKLGCVSPPTDFTEFTEVWGCCWLRGYGRMPYPPTSVLIRAICWRLFSARNFCAFRGFCGSTTACLVGAAETAAPPEIASVPSVEVSSQQEISVRSVGSVGGYFMNVAAWAWQDAIPSYTMGSEMPCIF